MSLLKNGLLQMKNRAIFLDRDGTINVDYGYVYKLEDMVLLPGVIEALQKFQKAGYLLIIVTNQSGVSRGYFTENDVNVFNNELKRKLALHDIVITDFFLCIHGPSDKCSCRKPSPQLITNAILKYNIEPTQSLMFGDKNSDVLCGENANVRSYLVTKEHSLLYWANLLLNK